MAAISPARAWWRWVLPQFDGMIDVPRIPDGFFARLELRVRSGRFLREALPQRNRYRVCASARNDEAAERSDYRRAELNEQVRIRSEGLLAAIAVGLNDIEVSRDGSNRLRYRVRYWTWAGYAVGLSGVLFVALLSALALSAALREHVFASPFGLAMFGGNLLFWGLLWPWVLVGLHRPHARRLLEQILNEELSAASTEPHAGGDAGPR